MNKSQSNGYKLAKRFMNSKDIFKISKNLLQVGYSCEIINTNESDNYFNLGYKKHILVKYVGNDNKSILPLYVYYKENTSERDFKQCVQVRYYY
jgi:hypothetical protein